MLSVRRHNPKKRAVHRKPEYLSLFTGSKFATPKSSNFGATASHWLLYILLFFFFSDFNRTDAWSLVRGALCVATRLYILYLAADESISGWEFLLLIPKSPQTLLKTPRCKMHEFYLRNMIYIYIYIHNWWKDNGNGRKDRKKEINRTKEKPVWLLSHLPSIKWKPTVFRSSRRPKTKPDLP